MDVHIGRPSSMHDSRILKESPLWNCLDTIPANHYILADGAYPCTTQLMVPYRSTVLIGAARAAFNNHLSKARQSIERAFGLLKGRWRKQTMIQMDNLAYTNALIASACLLHNFVLLTMYQNQMKKNKTMLKYMQMQKSMLLWMQIQKGMQYVKL